MLLLTIGLFAGAALGSVVMAFLAISAYHHGYRDAAQRRGEWRIELQARHQVAEKARSAA
jgi:hypothetical protein